MKPEEVFELFRLTDDKIALRASNGLFVSANLHPFGQGELIATRPTISGWEAFAFDYLEDGKLWLRAFNELYVMANFAEGAHGELIANRSNRPVN